MEKEKIEVPKPLVDSYLEFADILGISKDELIRALMQHAKNWGGCIRCKHSRLNEYVYRQGLNKRATMHMVWTTRTCALGLAQGTCGEAYSPFL